jgi:hypothetical protein
MFFLLIYNEKKISDYIDEMAGNKEKSWKKQLFFIQ